jgi:hypothetical protein
MKRHRYLCITTTGKVRAVVSSSEIRPGDANQAAWLKRECGEDVLLAVKVEKPLDRKKKVD